MGLVCDLCPFRRPIIWLIKGEIWRRRFRIFVRVFPIVLNWWQIPFFLFVLLVIENFHVLFFELRNFVTWFLYFGYVIYRSFCRYLSLALYCLDNFNHVLIKIHIWCKHGSLYFVINLYYSFFSSNSYLFHFDVFCCNFDVLTFYLIHFLSRSP